MRYELYIIKLISTVGSEQFTAYRIKDVDNGKRTADFTNIHDVFNVPLTDENKHFISFHEQSSNTILSSADSIEDLKMNVVEYLI